MIKNLPTLLFAEVSMSSWLSQLRQEARWFILYERWQGGSSSETSLFRASGSFKPLADHAIHLHVVEELTVLLLRRDRGTPVVDAGEDFIHQLVRKEELLLLLLVEGEVLVALLLRQEARWFIFRGIESFHQRTDHAIHLHVVEGLTVLLLRRDRGTAVVDAGEVLVALLLRHNAALVLLAVRIFLVALLLRHNAALVLLAVRVFLVALLLRRGGEGGGGALGLGGLDVGGEGGGGALGGLEAVAVGDALAVLAVAGEGDVAGPVGGGDGGAGRGEDDVLVHDPAGAAAPAVVAVEVEAEPLPPEGLAGETHRPLGVRPLLDPPAAAGHGAHLAALAGRRRDEVGAVLFAAAVALEQHPRRQSPRVVQEDEAGERGAAVAQVGQEEELEEHFVGRLELEPHGEPQRRRHGSIGCFDHAQELELELGV
ncbi:uncharacterized protein LOC121053489 [Oryza brachyantha]|uniref:uncharacterized protein LOC121053489 n=1 Tax=Oryza brachyantha TaxID=4533 RepID=UPI001ADA8A23|nr:uncharacterized protein LOC121053489 [Oryza brachyantha]